MVSHLLLYVIARAREGAPAVGIFWSSKHLIGVYNASVSICRAFVPVWSKIRLRALEKTLALRDQGRWDANGCLQAVSMVAFISAFQELELSPTSYPNKWCMRLWSPRQGLVPPMTVADVRSNWSIMTHTSRF